jgi:hypothetical protein
MPLEISIPQDSLDGSKIDKGECTHPAGHCYGSDGGSGIEENQKVDEGRGGEFRVLTLDDTKTQIVEDAYYNRCQYCQKYSYAESKEERDKKVSKI